MQIGVEPDPVAMADMRAADLRADIPATDKDTQVSSRIYDAQARASPVHVKAWVQ